MSYRTIYRLLRRLGSENWLSKARAVHDKPCINTTAGLFGFPATSAQIFVPSRDTRNWPSLGGIIEVIVSWQWTVKWGFLLSDSYTEYVVRAIKQGRFRWSRWRRVLKLALCLETTSVGRIPREEVHDWIQVGNNILSVVIRGVGLHLLTRTELPKES